MSNHIEVQSYKEHNNEDNYPNIDPMAPPQKGCVETDGVNVKIKTSMSYIPSDNAKIKFFSENGAARITDPKNITDDSMVEIDGITTNITTAKRLGLINQRDVDGYSEEVKPKPPATIEPPKPPEATTTIDFMSTEARNVVNLMGKKTGSPSYIDNLMMKCITHTYNNGVSDGPEGNDGEVAIRELASAIGVEPDVAEMTANNIINSIHSRVIGYANHLGADGQELFSWAAKKLSPRVYTQTLQRLYLNDMQVVPELIERKKYNNRY